MADSEEAEAEDQLSVKDTVRELEERVDTLEDRVMMERLEDLSLEDEIEVVEDFLGRQEEEIRDKLQMLDRIEEEYEETQVDEKLQYLYQQIQELKEEQEETSGGVREQEVSELRGRIDRLESQLEEVGTGSGDQNFDDVYDKLYTLRDRLKELKEQLESGEGISDAQRDRIVREVESRIDTSGSGASAREVKRRVLDEIEPEDVSQAALDDLKDEIDKLRGRIETHAELGGGEGEEVEAAGELRTRVAELEGKVEELEHHRGGEVSADVESVEGLRDELEELKEEVSEAAKKDLEEDIQSLREDLEELKEEKGGAGSEELESLRERVEDLENLKERLESLEDQVEDISEEGEVSIEELLEALEYEGEELEDRFKEILIRIEEIQDDIDRQGERMDSLSHAQNMFESNIGNLMQEQRELTAQLKKEDRKLDRKTDLLLETIEKGLEMEEEEFRDLLDRRLEGKGGEVKVKEEDLGTVQDELQERLEEEAAEGVHSLAEIAAENQRRVKELQEKVEDMEKHSPTIIE